MNLNDLALARESIGFLAKESTYGALAAFVAANAFGVIGLPEITQSEAFTDSDELQNTRSRPQRFRDKTPAGRFSLEIYSRPSGSAGSAPVEDVLLECALGKKTVNAGTSVVYTPAIALASFSLGHQVGHTVRFAAGCVVEELRLEVVNKGAVKWTVSGPCAKLVHAGKGTTVADSTTTLIKLTSGEAKLFDVGSRVSVGSEDNSGAGYAVTAVDESADTITISPALGSAPSAGETVQGFLPTPSLAGDPLQGRLGRVEMDSAVLSISQASLTVRNEIKMLDDLLDDQDYPQGFIPGTRTVAGSVDAYFLREYLAHFRKAKSQTNVAINLVAGSTAGSILTVAFAQAQLNTPALSGDIEIKETLEFEGMPSSSFEDELSISYT